MHALTCQYCGAAATYYESSAPLYNGRDYGSCWACAPCDAMVGCHPDGQPLGTLANKALRIERQAVKRVFNPLWEDIEGAYPGIPVPRGWVRQVMRTRAYQWLAAQMGLPAEACHVAMFDESQCRRAAQIIQDLLPTPAVIRDWAKAREPKKTRTRQACARAVAK
jgi:hypothetical protein